jgi:hypothetical protein
MLAVAVVVAFGGAIWVMVQPAPKPPLDPDDPRHLPILIGVAPERLGGLVGELYTGFDVYRDTPSFSARQAAGALDLATVRAAMSYLVVLFYRSATFQPEGMARRLRRWDREHVPTGWRVVIAGYADLRALSRVQAVMLRDSLPAVAEVLAEQGSSAGSDERSEAAEFRRIREVMIQGVPCRVALRHAQDKAPSAGLGQGLSTAGTDEKAPLGLVYKITDYELVSVLWVYDPDFVYRPDEQTAIRTLVMYDRIKKRFIFFLDGYKREGTLVALD